MFYRYNQNNSGGTFHFDEDKGITDIMWVEADSPEHADQRAETIGLYFDGCDAGVDCPCCGDRWSRVWDDGLKMPHVDVLYDFAWLPKVFVHFKDGSFRGITLDEAQANEIRLIPEIRK